jgi:hypothetical protein
MSTDDTENARTRYFAARDAFDRAQMEFFEARAEYAKAADEPTEARYRATRSAASLAREEYIAARAAYPDADHEDEDVVVSTTDRAAEYAAIATAWQAFCSGTTPQNVTRFNLDGQPVGVVLLVALAEPPALDRGFTGDVIVDVLGGLRAFIDYLDNTATRGGGGGIWLDGYDLDTLSRKVNAAVVLRGYEQAHLAAVNGGAR